MHKGRLEAFSDGVIAIIITIMVLEIHMPGDHHGSLASLLPLYPIFISYVMSFIYVGIYWNNHHHMMQVVNTVNGRILWANLHFLFWLSLMPLVTEWMGENNFTKWPVILYGFSLIMCAVSYTILCFALINHEGKNSLLAAAVGKDIKGRISLVTYVIGICFAWINPLISFGLYCIVACIWFIPDPRIEKKIVKEGEK